MSVVVIGVNHRTVPLGLLERMTIDDDHLDKTLADVISRENVSEAVVLSTCNRTEVYVYAERFHGAFQDVRNVLSESAFLAPEAFADHLYVLYDADAIRHLFCVAAGLDSAVLGENEILGQVKRAWQRAREQKVSGTSLNLLFRHSVEVGKRARSETDIARHITSVAQAAVAMAAQRLGGLAGRRVLVLGAGGMGEGMAKIVAAAGVSDFAIANRTYERSRDLADLVGGRAVRLSAVADELRDTDVLLTSTGANTIMLEHSDIEPAMLHRGDHPLLIVDIAVPRDIDPSVAGLDGVTLLDMDDVRHFTEAGVAERQREVQAVRQIVDEEVDRFLDASTARESAPLIVALRERAEDIRLHEIEGFGSRLAGLTPEQREAVEALTHRILAKLLHEPTVELKESAGTRRGDRLAESMRDLFDL
ncbi:MAG: Glutamyl-tRNA reductase [Acidimicrobiales bacterium]|nr:MAG: glutamyl-tRNA reductase [Actinomycetota bacterium]MBV6507521.1 Glutamyl-tRNA reductase [Acidimicrobiales bacterium]RIK07894.1 MAG: glutamyl-tRNA reductase [Acidobacteriota bacterium]